MADKNDQGKKPTLGLSDRGKLELKSKVDSPLARQGAVSKSSNTVTVEVKRRRPGASFETSSSSPSVDRNRSTNVRNKSQSQGASAGRQLSDEERAHRLQVLQKARIHDVERQKKEDEHNRIVAERKAAQDKARREAELAEQEAEAKRLVEKAKLEEERARKVEPKADVVEHPVAVPPKADSEKPYVNKVHVPKSFESEDQKAKGKKAAGHKKTTQSDMDTTRRVSGRLTLDQAFNSTVRERSLSSLRRAREKGKRQLVAEDMPKKQVRDVVIPEVITVQELSNRMAERGVDIIKALMKLGVMATINQTIDADTAELVVQEFGHKVIRVTDADVEIGLRTVDADDSSHMVRRAPVVTVMGHVDHGKTSLLDALRESDAAAHESGGITQHIGASELHLPNGKWITFIDTPGHEAFSSMRARGANVTDIVILVVAADDGVKQQTVEAIHHAKAAGVPIVVAINKMDTPGADPMRVKTELLHHEIVVEDMGGEVLTVEVSAKKRQNLEALIDIILLQAEILDLKANPDRYAEGVIIEAKVEKGRGSVATALIQKGTLKKGDIFVSGSEWGRVRGLLNDKGEPIHTAGPSNAVAVLGLTGTPLAGDDLVVVDSESKAREIVEYRQRKARMKDTVIHSKDSLEQMFSDIQAGIKKELPVVIKSDVQGSVEAISASLQKLSTDEVKIRILHGAVGGINESDITLARASDALVIGFNVRANPQAREMAKRDQVAIKYYSIIYNVIDDVKAAISGLESPVLEEKILGHAQIREIFKVSKVGNIAGCMVTNGVVRRNCKVRLLRDDVVIHEGALKTLRRFKDEAKEAKEGFECGIMLENYNDIQVGDVIECFDIEAVKKSS